MSATFTDLVVSERCTLREAMLAIDRNGREMVLVRDDAGRIVGLITDGDIRRGLLKGLGLEGRAADVMTRDFFTVSPDLDRASVLDIMKAHLFEHVPVLDAQRRLVAIHFLRDLIGAQSKPNIAVVMAGGRGTRLRPVTERIPKPMVEVAGRPMLERIVLHLVGHGIRTVYLAVNFMAEVIEGHFGDGQAFGCHIEYLREREPLGTGGALSLLPQRPAHPFVVMNADLVTRADLTGMLEAHAASGCAATLGVGPYDVQIPFGAVKESGGRLLGLVEKPRIQVLVNRGIYVIEPAALDLVPRGEEFPMTALFERLVQAGRPVAVFNFADPWVDVAAPEDLLRVHGLY